MYIYLIFEILEADGNYLRQIETPVSQIGVRDMQSIAGY